MIRLLWQYPKTLDDIYSAIQTAIDIEFSTLPPYLYAKFSIPEGKNVTAANQMAAIVGQEMIHMCLACNILNAIGGSPKINPPSYPGYLPGDVDKNLFVHLYPFSSDAMYQGMKIETPVDPVKPSQLKSKADSKGVTIGEYYQRLDYTLKQLPPGFWIPNRNQVWDNQFFQGQIFPINSYNDAHQAISDIVSEGEGSPIDRNPLDFQDEFAHYYRFLEMYNNKILVKADTPTGWALNGSFGIDWNAVYPAITDPETHDFSEDSQDAQNAQNACNIAFTSMVNELQRAFNGEQGRLGNAVRAMFDLRMAAIVALNIPLADGKSVAGPSFRYLTGEGV